MEKHPIRKALGLLGFVAAAALLAIGGLSLPWHGSRPPEAPVIASSARGSGRIRAGAAAVNVDLPPGVPIGGYARLAWTSEGMRDPIVARALLLEVPGCRVAVVSADVVLLPEPLARRVEALLADRRLDAVLVAATHSHAGPGGFADDVAFELGALGPYDPRVFEAIAASMAEAVRRATAAAVPARLTIARGIAEPLVKARSGGRVDGRMTSLRLTAASGAPIGELLVFPAHPTILGKANRALSAEWPGRVAATAGRGVRVVLQGAVGDQSVRGATGDGDAALDGYAAGVVATDDALPALPPIDGTALSTATASVALPEPAPRAVPGWLRRAASTVAWSLLPANARVTAVRIGPALLLAVPAEPTAEVAAEWRRAAGDGAEVVSLVGGYAGYVETPERTVTGAGEAVRSYYGPELAPRLEAAIAAAARATLP